jgi:hypothetical protein
MISLILLLFFLQEWGMECITGLRFQSSSFKICTCRFVVSDSIISTLPMGCGLEDCKHVSVNALWEGFCDIKPRG